MQGLLQNVLTRKMRFNAQHQCWNDRSTTAQHTGVTGLVASDGYGPRQAQLGLSAGGAARWRQAEEGAKGFVLGNSERVAVDVKRDIF